MTLPDLAESYRILTTEPAAVRLERDIVRVSGADAVSYLQGQISQDVAALAEGQSAWSLVLQPQGKVDAWFRITRVPADSDAEDGDDGPVFALDLDAGFADQLIDRLNRFKLRVKVDIDRVDGDMVAVRTNSPSEDFVSAQSQSRSDGPYVDLMAPPFSGTGVDLIGRGLAVPDQLTEVSAEAYEILRIEAGMPKMGAELTENTIPAAAGIVDLSASFTKGCYTGQELVARVDSRGSNTPTHLRVLRSEGEMLVGDVIGDDQGTITSAAAHPLGGSVALGYVKRSVDVPCSLSVGGTEAAITPVPSAADPTE